MYPTFRIADSSYVFGAPYSEEVKRRSSIFSTNLTMANADADRISLDLKSNFAAIAAARPIPHLELLCRFLMAVSRTTRGDDPAMTAERRSATLPHGILLVSLDLSDLFADSIALGLGESSRVVRNSLESPLPEISPPRSRRWRLTPRSRSPAAWWIYFWLREAYI
jgi:hypothetical protein